MTDWKELSTISHDQAAVAVPDELQAGHVEEATRGLEELIDASSRADRRALRSHPIRLMPHILKWKTRTERWSRSGGATIANARDEIEGLREDTPSLTEDVVRSSRDSCLKIARREVHAAMNREPTDQTLDRHDVFEAESILGDTIDTP
jgi:hypothetical protein